MVNTFPAFNAKHSEELDLMGKERKMADAGDILDAGDVSEMPETETASMKGKGIKLGENWIGGG